MKKVLIVIDMQNDFIAGSLGSPQARAIIENVREKIIKYRDDGVCVVFTQDTHSLGYLETHEGRKLPVEHCILGTDGWDIYEGLEDLVANRYYIRKCSFGYMGWNDVLDDVEQIELCGLCTDICVVSNALILRAIYPEAEITVDASCCAGATEEGHRAALLTMKMCQINIVGESEVNHD